MSEHIGRVWVEDRSMKATDWRVCSHPGCRNQCVAVLYRKTSSGRTRRQFCCAEHVYGRRVIDGVVQTNVAADSPAAKRGYVE